MFKKNWHEEEIPKQCLNHNQEHENFIAELELMHVFNLLNSVPRHSTLGWQSNADSVMLLKIRTVPKMRLHGDVGDECHYLFKCDYFAKDTKMNNAHIHTHKKIRPKSVVKLFLILTKNHLTN